MELHLNGFNVILSQLGTVALFLSFTLISLALALYRAYLSRLDFALHYKEILTYGQTDAKALYSAETGYYPSYSGETAKN